MRGERARSDLVKPVLPSSQRKVTSCMELTSTCWASIFPTDSNTTRDLMMVILRVF